VARLVDTVGLGAGFGKYKGPDWPQAERELQINTIRKKFLYNILSSTYFYAVILSVAKDRSLFHDH